MSDQKMQEKAGAGCIVCGATCTPRSVAGFDQLRRITSDCRAFGAQGYLAVCMECGAVQKRVDAQWLQEIGEIYRNYSTYYQSGGDEQIVFDRRSGQPRRRSDVLIDQLADRDHWPASMDVLDVGCGNGATLRAMGQKFPEWCLHGFELSDSALEKLKKIPGFKRLYTGHLTGVQQNFSLVSMVHAIEHFENPVQTLRELLPIVGAGRLFIEVCNIDENPFDILVADHLTHFSPQTLTVLLRRAGYTVTHIATDWVAKEISALAVRSEQAVAEMAPVYIENTPEQIYERISNYVLWLNNLVEKAQGAIDTKKSFGLFGTSIAATWLADQLKGKIDFFVDEDSSRIGKQHLGLPIVAPADVSGDSTVYIALAPTVAKAIAQRLAPSMRHVNWILPPS